MLSKIPWLTPAILMFCYCLYGWGLSVIMSPFLYWAIALGISAFLVMAINYSLILAVPITIGATVFIISPLALDAAIIRGNEYVQAIANTISKRGGLFVASIVVMAILWFSPLFWSNREMARNGFTKMQIFWFLTIVSWLGLGLGWLLGRWY